jgi:hypothetical protein
VIELVIFRHKINFENQIPILFSPDICLPLVAVIPFFFICMNKTNAGESGLRARKSSIFDVGSKRQGFTKIHQTHSNVTSRISSQENKSYRNQSDSEGAMRTASVGRFVGVRLPSQHCGLGPVVLSPGDSDVER